jgi:ribosomal protein S27AE
MTEIPARYRTKTEKKQVGVVWRECPQCSMEYGFEVNGGEYLQVGNVRIKYMRAICGDCGNVIHWGSMDRHLRKLTKRRK